MASRTVSAVLACSYDADPACTRFAAASHRPHAVLRLLPAVLRIVLYMPLVAAAGAAAEYGACWGVGANPNVYNFEIGGHAAKVLNDQPSVQLNLTRGIFLDDAFFVDRSFYQADAAVLRRVLRRRFEDAGTVSIDNHVLYVDWGGEGVLLDCGMGAVDNIFGPGFLFDLLEIEGIPRDSIKHILLTHGHPDHLGGLLEDLVDLEPAFPNATVHISRAEYEWWTSDQVDNGTANLPAEVLEANILFAKTFLGLVGGQISLFEMDEEPIPGFKPISTPWHTPGSVAYAIDDGDKGSLVFTGDSVTHKVLAIENPWIPFFSDWQPEPGIAMRWAFLEEAVAGRWQLLCNHASFPGLFYVSDQGSGFQATAAGYTGSARATSVCDLGHGSAAQTPQSAEGPSGE